MTPWRYLHLSRNRLTSSAKETPRHGFPGKRFETLRWKARGGAKISGATPSEAWCKERCGLCCDPASFGGRSRRGCPLRKEAATTDRPYPDMEGTQPCEQMRLGEISVFKTDVCRSVLAVPAQLLRPGVLKQPRPRTDQASPQPNPERDLRNPCGEPERSWGSIETASGESRSLCTRSSLRERERLPIWAAPASLALVMSPQLISLSHLSQDCSGAPRMGLAFRPLPQPLYSGFNAQWQT